MSCTVSVLDFGADPTGVADSAAAIQAALDSLNEAGCLYFPAGDYRVEETIDHALTGSWGGVTFRGDGPASRILWHGGNNKPVFHVRGVGGVGWYSRVLFENFQIVGNCFTGSTPDGSVTALYTGVAAIQFGSSPEDATTGVCNPTVRNMLLRECGFGILGYYESDETAIYNNYIDRPEQYGIYNAHGGSGWWIRSNHISDGQANSTGIRLSLSSNIVEDNIIQGGAFSVGVQVDGGASAARSFSIRNNYFESQTAGDYAIICYSADTGVIENNTFNGFPGAILIRLVGACNNVVIGANRHGQSAGLITSLIHADSGCTHCMVTARQHTTGSVTTITGPFAYIAEYEGNYGFGTGAPHKKLVISDNGANGLEVEPREGDYTRVISYNRSTNNYTPLFLEASQFITVAGALKDYPNDTAAAGAGVPLYGLYRTASAVKIRVS